jgi:hypothetical protein
MYCSHSETISAEAQAIYTQIVEYLNQIFVGCEAQGLQDGERFEL